MDSELKFEISLLKTKYSLDEEILVRVFLLNFSDDPMTVNSRFVVNKINLPGEVFFDIQGTSGKIPFSARVNAGKPDAEDFSTIQPWNFVGKQLTLQDYFLFESSDRYQLTATYFNQDSGSNVGLSSWVGSLQSNTIDFQIEKV